MAVHEVKIASDAVAIIAALAATGVKGVSSMAGNITSDLIARFGTKGLSKGVRVVMEDGLVYVDVSINVKYGCNIMQAARQVQAMVGQQIETMTGFDVAEVNVRVAGVDLGE